MEFVTEQFTYEDAITLDRLISTYAKANMIVFELGTYTGRASLTMLPHIQRMNGRLYCVDWFMGNPNAEAIINVSYQKYNILDVFLNNIQESGFEDYVTTLVGATNDIATIIADESADFIFIDADHRYTHIRNDILNWYPKLKRGGLICGHDFEKRLEACDSQRVLEMCEEDFIDGCHYGVIRAVSEFFPDVEHEGRIWYAQKGEQHRPLLTAAIDQRIISDVQEPTMPDIWIHNELPDQEKDSPIVQRPLDSQYLQTLFSPDATSISLHPHLIEKDYKGFNIVRYQKNFYALAKTLGHINLNALDEQTLIKHQESQQCFIGKTLEETKRQIDQLSPELIEEGYFGFNLVYYKGKYYALAQTLGTVDLTSLDQDYLDIYYNNNQCRIGASLFEAKNLVDLLLRDEKLVALQQELDHQREIFETTQQELDHQREMFVIIQQEQLALKQELTVIKSRHWFQLMNRVDRIKKIIHPRNLGTG